MRINQIRIIAFVLWVMAIISYFFDNQNRTAFYGLLILSSIYTSVALLIKGISIHVTINNNNYNTPTNEQR